MCGIFGWSVTNNKYLSVTKRIALSSVLQTMNDNRGGDSWGYYRLNDDGTFEVVKGLGNIVSTPSEEIARSKTVMCHTRKATTGAIKVENCHPFEVKHIIGAHNGMVSNHTEMNKTHNRTCEVDSMHIFHNIANQIPLSELEGYGAIEYINKKIPNRVFLAKMKMGQLSVYGIGSGPKDCHGVVWSSDESHLEKALSCAGIQAFEYGVKEGLLYFIENGTLFVTEKKMEFKERTYTHQHYAATGYSSTPTSYGGNFHRSHTNDYDDDRDFMEYLSNRYGSSTTSTATSTGSAQSGNSKSQSQLPLLTEGGKGREVSGNDSNGSSSEENTTVALESLGKDTDSAIELDDGTVITDVDVNNAHLFREKILEAAKGK